jgi:hypothetical protein
MAFVFDEGKGVEGQGRQPREKVGGLTGDAKAHAQKELGELKKTRPT